MKSQYVAIELCSFAHAENFFSFALICFARSAAAVKKTRGYLR